MDIGKYKQAMSYLLNSNAALKTFTLDPDARLTDNDPEMVISPQDILPKNPIPNMQSAPGIPDPRFRQLELAGGGRVGFKFGGNVDKLKKLEQTVLESNKDLYNALSKEEVAKRAGYTSAANLSGRKEMTRIFNNLIPIENKISNHFNDI